MTAPVIVGVDGSERSQDAVVLAAFGGLSTTGATGYRSANEALRHELLEKTLEAVASLAPGLDARHRLLDGDAAAQLARCSSELDLLVLGSRGYGPLRTVLLGSVSRTLVRTSRCPVVVLPRGAEVPWSPETTYADWATLIE